MLRSFGLWRPATRRSRAEWPVSLASFLLLLCGTTLLAAGTLYADTVSLGGLRRSVADAEPLARSITLRASASPTVAASADPIVRAALADTLGAAAGPIVRVARVVTFAPGSSSDDQVRQLVTLASEEGVADHATLTGGRWPTPGRDPIEAALPDTVADRLGVGIGDRLELPAPAAGETLQLTVVGRWRPTDTSDAYWLGDPLDLGGLVTTSTEVTAGPLIVAPEDLDQRVASASEDVQWRAFVDADQLTPEELPGLRASLAGLRARLGQDLPKGPTLTLTTELPAVLESVERSVLVSRSGILLLTIQFAVLAGYAVLLVAGMIAERRRPEVALLRSRGAGSGHVALMAFLEGLLLAVPAALLAPFLAVGVLRLLGTIGPLAGLGLTTEVLPGTDVVLVSFLAAGIYLLALTLPTVGATPALAGVRASLGRQVGRTLPQRLGLDIVLVVLAIIAIWQLRTYGAPLTTNARGVLGIDPLLVAAPAIGLLAGVLLAARLIPRLAELAERYVARRPSLVGPMSTQQVARRPLRYTRSAMLLMLAAALGTFAAAQAATWSTSQVDQAAYTAGADIRLVASDFVRTPSWALGSAIRGIDGVEGASPVRRESLDVGRAVRDAELVGVDPTALASMVSVPGPDGARVPGLLDRLSTSAPEAAGMRLDGQPTRIALDVDAALGLPPGEPTNPDGDPGHGARVSSWDGVIPSIVIQDGDGQVQRVELDRGTLGGGAQRLEADLTTTVDDHPAAATGPLRILGVELRLTAPPGEPVIIGTVGIDGLLTDDGTGWRPVGVDLADVGWAWDRSDVTTAGAPYVPPPDRPMTIQIGGEDGAPALDATDFADPGPTFRLRPRPDETLLPAIASASFLEATGSQVGDRIAAQRGGLDLAFRIDGTADLFPPLDPSIPFLVVGDAALEDLRYLSLADAAPAAEWWVTAAPGRSGDVAAILRHPAYGAAEVIDREAEQARLVGDPVALGVIGALGLGALAALLFAAIGFLVSATISASERAGEFALLRALGLSSGGLSVWLTLENAFLLATGLLTGTLLGLLLAWLILPVSTLTATGATPVPAPVVVVPWDLLLLVAASAIVLLAVAVRLATRQLPSRKVSGVLRAWEG